MEVLAHTVVVIISQYMCIKSTHCTSKTCTVLHINYVSIKLGKKDTFFIGKMTTCGGKPTKIYFCDCVLYTGSCCPESNASLSDCYNIIADLLSSKYIPNYHFTFWSFLESETIYSKDIQEKEFLNLLLYIDCIACLPAQSLQSCLAL